jgi:hypothetical protein
MKCIVYGIMVDVNKYDCHFVLMKCIVCGIMADFNRYVCQHNIVYYWNIV